MTPHDKRLSLARLQRLAKRLRRSALLSRNGDNTAAGEARALTFEQDAAALLWACHELGAGADLKQYECRSGRLRFGSASLS
jgi:hypothetical protein